MAPPLEEPPVAPLVPPAPPDMVPLPPLLAPAWPDPPFAPAAPPSFELLEQAMQKESSKHDRKAGCITASKWDPSSTRAALCKRRAHRKHAWDHPMRGRAVRDSRSILTESRNAEQLAQCVTRRIFRKSSHSERRETAAKSNAHGSRAARIVGLRITSTSGSTSAKFTCCLEPNSPPPPR